MKVYTEDGWKAEIEIIENFSDAETEHFRVKVIRTIQESPIFNSPADGEIFEPMKLRGMGGGGFWQIVDEN